MSNRLERLQNLQTALNDYVSKEKSRIEKEVSVLQSVLDGRTGGSLSSNNSSVIAAVAQNDIASYLGG